MRYAPREFNETPMPSEPSHQRPCRDAERASYTTYPSPEWFVEACDASVVSAWAAAQNAPHWQRAIALDVRLPAVAHGASACGRADCVDSVFFDHLEREMTLYRTAFGRRPDICDMRWSSNSALTETVLQRLRNAIQKHFGWPSLTDFSVHLDPQTDEKHLLPALHKLGATSVHIGVPSAAPSFSAAATPYMHPEESFERTLDLVSAARKVGLPGIEARYIVEGGHRSRTSQHESFKALIASGPTRVVLGCASEPALYDPYACAEVCPGNRNHWRDVAVWLLEAGYLYIAQDVFALPSDALAVAHRQGRLTRQPNGYSTRPVGALLALGPKTIGYIGALYYQNHRVLQHYLALLAQGSLPVERGLQLSQDDLVRRTIILSLSTNLFVDVAAVEAAYGINLRSTFAAEWGELTRLERAGLLKLDTTNITLTSAGRLACGAVCRVFDRHTHLLAERTSHVSPL